MKKVLLVMSIVLPIVYMFFLSSFSYFKYPLLLPNHLNLNYWQDVLWHNPLFYKGLFSSFIISIFTAILTTIIGFMTGRAVVDYLGGFSKKIALMISLPLLIPGMILFLGMHQVILVTPFKNSIIGVVLVHTVICLPYVCNIAIAYFTGIPKDYEAIAQTLGSSGRDYFFKVLLPLLRPGLTMSMVISMLISNTEYFSTFLVGGGNVVSLSMVMFPYINNGDYGRSAIMGLVFLGLHGLLFLIVDKLNKNDIKVFYGG